jgi:CubicO group peptidase (beta-lactamase class C family)
MSEPTNIEGRVEPGFERVREAFAQNFRQSGPGGVTEVGAACCVHVNGRKVVDLWGGIADRASGRPWAEDTVVLVFSTSKGVAAACAHLLVQRGKLALDAPVREYWPEFAEAGKRDVPVRMLLNHRVGLPAIDRTLSYDEVMRVTPVVEALAAQTPFWEPGSAHGYHALTYGWLVGELVRRVTGLTIGRFLQEEITEPLDLDLWIGLPEAEEPRVAPLVPSPPPEDPRMAELARTLMGPGTLAHRALTLGGALEPAPGEGTIFNRRATRATEMPAANAVGTARALSRLYASLIGEVDGIRVLAPETIERARRTESDGTDRTLQLATRFGLGFMVPWDILRMLGPGSFGHAGAGGSLAFAHPESGVAFAYTMNQMSGNLAGDLRSRSLIDAVEASL